MELCGTVSNIYIHKAVWNCVELLVTSTYKGCMELCGTDYIHKHVWNCMALKIISTYTKCMEVYVSVVDLMLCMVKLYVEMSQTKSA